MFDSFLAFECILGFYWCHSDKDQCFTLQLSHVTWDVNKQTNLCTFFILCMQFQSQISLFELDCSLQARYIDIKMPKIQFNTDSWINKSLWQAKFKGWRLSKKKIYWKEGDPNWKCCIMVSEARKTRLCRFGDWEVSFN